MCTYVLLAGEMPVKARVFFAQYPSSFSYCYQHHWPPPSFLRRVGIMEEEEQQFSLCGRRRRRRKKRKKRGSLLGLCFISQMNLTDQWRKRPLFLFLPLFPFFPCTSQGLRVYVCEAKVREGEGGG